MHGGCISEETDDVLTFPWASTDNSDEHIFVLIPDGYWHIDSAYFISHI